MKKSNKEQFGNLVVLFAVAVFGVLLVTGVIREPYISNQVELKKFSSQEEIKQFLKENTESYPYYGTFGAQVADVGGERALTAEAVPGKVAEEYSVTNIQVEGVDEADIVKSDGKYLYVVSGNKVVIIDAYPAESAKILSEIDLDTTVYEIYINDDKLVVFGYEYGYEEKSLSGSIPIEMTAYPQTFIHVYDVSDRQKPVLERNASVSGNYFDSRMIGDYVYAIINQPVYYMEPGPIPMPVIRDGTKAIAVPASEIYYFGIPDSSYIYTNIVAVNTQNADEEVSRETFLMGYSHTMYASVDNIYIVYTKRLRMSYFYDKIIEEAILPLVPANVRTEINNIRNSDMNEYEKMQEIGEVFRDYVESLGPQMGANFMKRVEERMQIVQTEIAKEIEKTIIHKISVNMGKIEYKADGEVPGYVLNQFSMSEHNGYFRIATTTGNWRTTSSNHLYILDGDLNIVGKVEDLAEGERIYATRFLGDKGYMVTFRQIDPLFVIDLSSPTNPQVLGYLKIPGVSDYLHPYDETHLIGVGRDATEEGRILGMKLSLFDVSDFSDPVEVSKYIIGEQGTYSEVLSDHKAFLFDRSKSLLVMPVSVSEGGKWNAWQGAYVFNLDLENGFVLKGKVTHINETTTEDEYGYYYDYFSQIRRSLYIDDVLYTVSSRMVKMNDLDNLDNEINKIELPQKDEYYPPILIE